MIFLSLKQSQIQLTKAILQKMDKIILVYPHIITLQYAHPLVYLLHHKLMFWHVLRDLNQFQ